VSHRIFQLLAASTANHLAREPINVSSGIRVLGMHVWLKEGFGTELLEGKKECKMWTYEE
jgi:hypothetical protein